MPIEPEKTIEEKFQALEQLIESGTKESREAFYRDIEGFFFDILGLSIDQLELSYPYDKANPESDNARKFDIAKRIILNRFNQHTKNQLKKLLNEHSIIRIIEHKLVADVYHITFGKPTLATGKRLEKRSK
jgi:hypothetical protein